MPQFLPGETKVGVATYVVSPVFLYCQSELWLGNGTKAATSGKILFTSGGFPQPIEHPIVMPGKGIYNLHLDLYVRGVLAWSYTHPEAVVIDEAPVIEPSFSIAISQFYPPQGSYLWPGRLAQVLFALVNQSSVALDLVVKVSLGRMNSTFTPYASGETAILHIEPNTTAPGYGLSVSIPANYPEGWCDVLITARNTATGKEVSNLYRNQWYVTPSVPSGLVSCQITLKEGSWPTWAWAYSWWVRYFVNDRWGESVIFVHQPANGNPTLTLTTNWYGDEDPGSAILAVGVSGATQWMEITFQPWIPANGASYEVDWLAHTVRRIS